MDPRIAWFQSETLGKAHSQWMRIVEATNINFYPRSDLLQSEQLGTAHAQWMKLVEATNSNFDRNMQNNTSDDFRTPEYISLNNVEDCGRKNEANVNQNGAANVFRKRKRENKASTYGLNHSSNLSLIENGCLTPWISPDRIYTPGVIG